MNTSSKKNELRHYLQQARRNMTNEVREAKNAAILSHVITLLSDLNTPRIAAYTPLPTEPGGAELIDTLFSHSSELFLPRSHKDRTLTWGLFTGWESTTPGMFGIPEPKEANHDSTTLHALDLILVPALAVNKEGFRLGKGAGYYDRALAGCTTPTATLVFHEEILPEIPTEEHDVPTRFIISEKGIGTIEP